MRELRQSAEPGQKPPATAAPSGDGGVTAFHDNGGRILQHARLVLMFWGNAWTDAATSPSQTQFTNAISNLVSDPWGTQMSQYRGIGPLSLEDTVTITSSDPPITMRF